MEMDDTNVVVVKNESPETATITTPSKKDKTDTLDVETLLAKHCHVCVAPLESVVFDKPLSKPKAKPLVSDLPEGQHFTRSWTRRTPDQASRKPCKASTGVKYTEATESSEDDKGKCPKETPVKTKPSAAGPLNTRVNAQNFMSQHPARHLPPVTSNTDNTEDVDADTPVDNQVLTAPSKNSNIVMKSEASVCGVFKTESHTLKKCTSTRKYKCRMCREGVDGAKDLLEHHQKKDGIVYCKICQKAFNNPLSLTRHIYEHMTSVRKVSHSPASLKLIV